MRTMSGVLAGLVLAVLSGFGTRDCPAQTKDVGWPSYGNDAGGGRYSEARQIDASNVEQLKVAWTFRTGALDEKRDLNEKATFETTPILVDGKLYLSTPWGQVFALDPVTGTKIWEFDPDLDLTNNYSEASSRGVSAWHDPKAKRGSPCALRIFIGTIDARLIAIDGQSGKPCTDFGTEGQVDLTRDVELRNVGDYQVTSAPAIAGDVVITGSSIGDNRAVRLERGIVRGFDARTGKQRSQVKWCPPANDGFGCADLVRRISGPRYG